jgi:hypothetical protein
MPKNSQFEKLAVFRFQRPTSYSNHCSQLLLFYEGSISPETGEGWKREKLKQKEEDYVEKQNNKIRDGQIDVLEGCRRARSHGRNSQRDGLCACRRF